MIKCEFLDWLKILDCCKVKIISIGVPGLIKVSMCTVVHDHLSATRTGRIGSPTQQEHVLNTAMAQRNLELHGYKPVDIGRYPVES